MPRCQAPDAARASCLADGARDAAIPPARREEVSAPDDGGGEEASYAHLTAA